MTAHAGQDPALLRQINSAAVLAALHRVPSTTISDLARHVGISRRTAHEITLDLVGRGWARPAPTPPEFSTLGRPAQWYAFQENAGMVVALDIHRDGIRAAAADLRGSVLAHTSVALDPKLDAVAVDRLCTAVTHEVLQAASSDATALLALAISCTGIIGVDGTVTLSGRLPGLSGHNLKEAMETAFGCPVVVENDCRAALAAELWMDGATTESVVYVSARDVLGCAYSIDGSVYRGTHGAAAEVGLLAAFGWNDAHELLQTPDPEPVELARALALGIAALVAAVDPSSVVVAMQSHEDSARMAEALEPLLAELCGRHVPTCAATVHHQAGVLGAIRLALDVVEAGLFHPNELGPTTPSFA